MPAGSASDVVAGGRIAMRDPLAEFLGAADGGRLEYSYADAVKLTGHSCPTVAGAWLAILRALAALYPGETPERGAIRVELRGQLESMLSGRASGTAPPSPKAAAACFAGAAASLAVLFLWVG